MELKKHRCMVNAAVIKQLDLLLAGQERIGQRLEKLETALLRKERRLKSAEVAILEEPAIRRASIGRVGFKCRAPWRTQTDVAELFRRGSGQSSMLVVPSENMMLGKRLALERKTWGVVDYVLGFCVVQPENSYKLFWDLVGTVLIAYDMATITVIIGYDSETSALTELIFLCSLGFWTCDIVFTFFTGLPGKWDDKCPLLSLQCSAPDPQMRPSIIALQYMKTWLVVDLFIVGVDYVVLAISSGIIGSVGHEQRSLRIGKIMRLSRIVRSLRLMRIARLKSLFEQAYDRASNDYVRTFLEVLWATFVIFALAHVISCIWYGIGRLDSSGETAWIRRYGAIPNSFLFKYFLSVHWAMTQFVPANMEVVPANFPERFFSVCVLLFALIVFSAFLSNLTHLMLKFGHLFCRYDVQKSLLRRYLRDRKVSKDLAFRVKNSIDDALKSMHSRSVVKEKDVALLILLSEPLRMDLKHENFDVIFRPPSFFRVLHEESVHATRELCFTGLHNSHFSWGDNMFSENEANATHSAFFSGNWGTEV